MSKFSTDDLVKWVEGIAPGFHECCPPFAIIARLRAADKLCDATSRLATNWNPETLADIRKAIAEYEEAAYPKNKN